MQWTFVFCLLISSTFIASSNPDEPRHKRSLAFLKSLFFHDMTRTRDTYHGKCTKPSQCKPSKQKQTSAFSDRQKNSELDVSERERGEENGDRTRTKPPRGGRNNGSSVSDQGVSRDLGTTNSIARTTPNNSNKENPQRTQNLCDTKLIVSGEWRTTNLPNLCNFDQNIYQTPMIYAYDQPNGETMQNFALDNNLAFIVPENVNQLPIPGYVDDGLENVIWSVPPYPHQPFPSYASEQYEDSIMSPYVLLDHQQGNIGMNMLPNKYMSMYTGKPIVVIEDTSEKNKPTNLFKDSEINKGIDRKKEQKSRGDIPD